MAVPGQSGDKKHRFLSVPEAFLHKCKCLFQLPSDLFRTGLSLLRHFRKQLPDPFKASHVTEKETAQSVPAPVTTYALFRDGKFVTQGIQSDKKFLKLAGAAD